MTEAVPESKAKTLHIITAYINQKGAVQPSSVTSPEVTSETQLHTSPYNAIILDGNQKYNSNFNQDYQGKNVKNSTGEVSPEIFTEIITASIYRLEEIKTAKRYIV